MADASHLLHSLKSIILSKRNTVDEFQNNCYKIILELASKVSINKNKPPTATIKKNHNNAPSESAFDYF